ncbi:LemA family protein [Oscillospiraceae bacterium PP1C4]
MKKISTGIIVLIVLVAVIAIAAMSLFGSYNGIAVAKENVDTQQSAIQTQLQRRSDLIPNLVNTVKGLSAQEQSVIDSVTAARAQLSGAKNMGEMAAANDNLSGALSRLLVVVENYPQIQSSQGYISLMDELAGTENRISVSRVDYNNAVKAYNSKIITFPSNIVAGMFGFEKAAYFEAEESAQKAPNVQF